MLQPHARNELYSVFRFVFVLCIVGYHFAPSAQQKGWWIFSNGQVLVTFFFVLSGFFARRSLGRTAVRFWCGKLAALFPVYCAVLLLAVLIEAVAGGFRPAVIAADVLLVQAWIPDLQLALNAPAWFMSALAACFLIWPAMWKMRPALLLPVSGVLWAGVQLISVSLYTQGQLGEFSYWLYFPPFHFASFLMGAVAADFFRARLSMRRGCVWSAAALALVFGSLGSLPGSPPALRMCAEISLFAPLFAFLVWTIAVLPESVTRLFDNKWCAGLGLAAYPVYLLQLPVYKIFHQLVLKPWSFEMNWPLFCAYVFVLCAAAWALLMLLCKQSILPLHDGAGNKPQQ